MKIVVFLLYLLSSNAIANSLEFEFEKFFKVPMPLSIEDDGVIYIAPKESEVIPVTGQTASVSVHITVPRLSKLLILNGQYKYSAKLCKRNSEQIYIASYVFDPLANISSSLVTVRENCRRTIIVWAQTSNGNFYKTEKPVRVFDHHQKLNRNN